MDMTKQLNWTELKTVTGCEIGLSLCSVTVTSLLGAGSGPKFWKPSPKVQAQADSVPFKCVLFPLKTPAPSSPRGPVLEQEGLTGYLTRVGSEDVVIGPLSEMYLLLMYCLCTARLPPSAQMLLGVWAATGFHGHHSHPSSVELQCEADQCCNIHSGQAGMCAVLVLSWETSQPTSWFQSAISAPLCKQTAIPSLLMGRVRVFHSPPVSPTGPLISQQNSSSFCQSPGLGNSISGSDCSLPREESSHIISLFLWFHSYGHRSWSDHFSSLPTWFCLYLSFHLVVQESFCYL